ncbi:MAG: hypothetical protein ACXV97_03530 [Chthoniobacterales bacterium]
MRLPRKSKFRCRAEASTYITLVIVVLGVIGGIYFYLKSSRDQTQTGGRAFANEVMQRVVLQRDMKFLSLHLSPQGKVDYPPSYIVRLMANTRDPGEPNPNYKLSGDLTFQNQFFEPSGTFTGEFSYPTGPASLEIRISHPAALWQVDYLNFTYTPRPTPTPTPFVPPPPPPTPTPTAIPTPTPTPTPEPEQKPHRRKR